MDKSKVNYLRDILAIRLADLQFGEIRTEDFTEIILADIKRAFPATAEMFEYVMEREDEYGKANS